MGDFRSPAGDTDRRVFLVVVPAPAHVLPLRPLSLIRYCIGTDMGLAPLITWVFFIRHSSDSYSFPAQRQEIWETPP